MNIENPGNWPIVGAFASDLGPSSDATVYQCPVCLALTAEPLYHGDYHTRRGEATAAEISKLPRAKWNGTAWLTEDGQTITANRTQNYVLEDGPDPMTAGVGIRDDIWERQVS